MEEGFRYEMGGYWSRFWNVRKGKKEEWGNLRKYMRNYWREREGEFCIWNVNRKDWKKDLKVKGKRYLNWWMDGIWEERKNRDI